MIASDTDIKRALQQVHSAAAKGLSEKDQAFGLAIAFMTTTFAVTRQLTDPKSARSYAASLEGVQRVIVADAVKNASLTVIQSDTKPGEDQDDAHYRHLRNCFAHCNWTYDESQVTQTSMPVHLEDYNPAGKLTFSADAQLPDLVNLAERLLVETWRGIP